jgi:membrane-associated phospholipid phosphatase
MTAHFRRYPERYWLAFYLFLAIYQFATHRYLYEPHRQNVGHFLSGPIYVSFVIVSVGILLCPKARLRHGMWAGWWALDVTLCNFLISQSMKLAIPSPRPGGSASLSGFPSGHTMFSFALAYLMLQYRPKLAPLWFGMAFAVGWSRIDTLAHYPYQVFFGAVFGLTLGWLISVLHSERGLLLPRLLRRKPAVA